MTNDYSSNSAAQSMRETLYPDKPVGAVGFLEENILFFLRRGSMAPTIMPWVYDPGSVAMPPSP